MPLSNAEVDKLFEEAIEKMDREFYNYKPIFNENSYVCSYKFTEEQLKEICIASKCKVHIPTANILFRLEQHYREKRGEPNKNKLSRNKQKRILDKSIREYNRKREYYNGRQEKREIATKEIRKTIWTSNRINYFQLLNLTFYDPEETIDENGNINKDLEINRNDTPVYDFSFKINTTSDIQNYERIEITPENSEPIVSYTDFNSITIITSTQQLSPR